MFANSPQANIAFLVFRWKGKQITIGGHVIMPLLDATEANHQTEV
jgi:hypothetical protein